MRVDFTCEECNQTKTVSYAIQDGPPKEVLCDHDHKMKRVMKKPSVHVPDYFADNDFTAMVTHMKNAPRPSGRQKLVF